MSLRAVAWTILIAGVVALGTFVNEANLRWEILLNTIPTYAPRATQPGLSGLFDLRGENESRETEAVLSIWPLMLPMTLQFIIVMIATAINVRLQCKLDNL